MLGQRGRDNDGEGEMRRKALDIRKDLKRYAGIGRLLGFAHEFVGKGRFELDK